MTRTLFAVAMLWSGSAIAGDGTVVAYECANMKPEDGLRCRLANIEDQGPTLLIRLITRDSSSRKQKDRTNYVIRKISDAFIASGGRYIVHRVNGTDGNVLERLCTLGRRRTTENCYEWDEPNDDLDAEFKPIERAGKAPQQKPIARVLTISTVACIDRDTYDKLEGLHEYGATIGLKELMDTEVAAGRCLVLKKGSTATQTKAAKVGKFDFVALRPDGSKTEYWTNVNAVEP